MGTKIFFIGGASASGKSKTTREFSQQSSLPIIELDRFYDIFKPVIHDEVRLNLVTQNISVEIVKQLLITNTSYILEGGWINPQQANDLKKLTFGNFCPVYCGYPTANIEDRLKTIRKNKEHWLSKKSEQEALEFLKSQVEGSRWYKHECEKYDIQFFDFSEFEVGAHNLITCLVDWYNK